jgi:hypothetical protein
MCRREIPQDFLEHPDLVQGPVEPVVVDECSAVSEVDVDEACSSPRTEEPR